MMTQQDFIDRTGFYPSTEEFNQISFDYMQNNFDKDTYCKNWKEVHLLGASRRLALDHDRQWLTINNYQKAIEALHHDVEHLTKQLEIKSEAYSKALKDLKKANGQLQAIKASIVWE